MGDDTISATVDGGRIVAVRVTGAGSDELSSVALGNRVLKRRMSTHPTHTPSCHPSTRDTVSRTPTTALISSFGKHQSGIAPKRFSPSCSSAPSQETVAGGDRFGRRSLTGKVATSTCSPRQRVASTSPGPCSDRSPARPTESSSTSGTSDGLPPTARACGHGGWNPASSMALRTPAIRRTLSAAPTSISVTATAAMPTG
jgi:hypothetical protein